MKEIWKDVPGYEGFYQVSDLGRVRSLDRLVETVNRWGPIVSKRKGRYLSQSINENGYLHVHLYVNKKPKIFGVHQLVAMAFLGHKRNGHKIEVDHINHKPSDNRLKNLRLVTQRQNTSHKKKKGTSKYPGVSWDPVSQKWKAQIHAKAKKENLGRYDTELEAAEAYQSRLKEINS
jgi:hypothetical protein